MTTKHDGLVAGTRVRVTRPTPIDNKGSEVEIVGVVIDHRPEPTGSWFAHAKNGRLPLDRLRLRKDDGEITTLVLDEHAVVTVLETP